MMGFGRYGTYYHNLPTDNRKSLLKAMRAGWEISEIYHLKLPKKSFIKVKQYVLQKRKLLVAKKDITGISRDEIMDIYVEEVTAQKFKKNKNIRAVPVGYGKQ